MKDYSDVNTILDDLKARYNLPSDYKLAKFLDITRTRLSNYRCTNQTIDDDLAARIDNLLELPEGVIALEMHAKRSKCPQISNTFHELAQKLAAGALCVALMIGSFAPKVVEASGQFVPFNNNIHYAYQWMRRRRREKQLNCVTQTNYRYIAKSLLNFNLTKFNEILILGLENNNNKEVYRHAII